MLFSFLNPPKGKVLRKRPPNDQSNPPSRRPTKKIKPESLAATLDPTQESTKSVRPKVTRSMSLKKRNSRAGPGARSAVTTNHVERGSKSQNEGTKPVRSKSLIKTILERRKERIEAGNKAYDEMNGNGNGTRAYNPGLGVDNLPLAHYSGLRIASPIARIGRDGGNETDEDVDGDGNGNAGVGIGIAIGGHVREGEEHGTSDVGMHGGAYWGDYAGSRRDGYGGDRGGDARGGEDAGGGGGGDGRGRGE